MGWREAPYFPKKCKIPMSNAPSVCCCTGRGLGHRTSQLVAPFGRLHRPSTCTPKNLDGLITYLRMSLTSGEVLIIGEPFGRLHEIKFDDHDLANLEAFPNLVPELYLEQI